MVEVGELVLGQSEQWLVSASLLAAASLIWPWLPPCEPSYRSGRHPPLQPPPLPPPHPLMYPGIGHQACLQHTIFKIGYELTSQQKYKKLHSCHNTD